MHEANENKMPYEKQSAHALLYYSTILNTIVQTIVD